jgi:phosphoglucosamine mutase
MYTVDSAKLGKAIRVEDAKTRYVNFCKSTIAKSFHLKGLKIVLDCANGATYHIAPPLFCDLGADLTVLGAKPNGLNINKHSGSTHLDTLQKTVLSEKADLGIAFDGDGDRVLMVDSLGEIVDGDELLFLLAQRGVKTGHIQGGVVGTAMSNLGLELALNELGLAFIRTSVGDRYVNEALQTKNWQLGGEASGHIILRRVSKTGDGIIIALQVLEAIQSSGLSLHNAKKAMKKFPQILINIGAENPSAIMEAPSIKKAILLAEKVLMNRGRVLLRPSGTEPVVRVMVEGNNLSEVKNIANKLAETVKLAIR